MGLYGHKHSGRAGRDLSQNEFGARPACLPCMHASPCPLCVMPLTSCHHRPSHQANPVPSWCDLEKLSLALP